MDRFHFEGPDWTGDWTEGSGTAIVWSTIACLPASFQAATPRRTSAIGTAMAIAPASLRLRIVVVTRFPSLLALRPSATIGNRAMDVQQTRFSAQEIAALGRRIARPIVLVGMMGVGKSSVGKRLSTLLDCAFVDADDEIERSAQMTIPEIFDAYGEDYFRDGERRVIARLLADSEASRRRIVIATGGGAFCNAETRALILDKAITVWLDSEVDTLVERTARKENRPLLRGGDPHQILGRLREERARHYAQAPIHVTSGSGPHVHTINKVLQGISEWL
jgi:shikimate kinase